MRSIPRPRIVLLSTGLVCLLAACSEEVSVPARQETISESEPPPQSAGESEYGSPGVQTSPPADNVISKRGKPLSEVVAGSWDAANVDELNSEAKRITLNFGDDGTCEIVVHFDSGEQVHEGTYEVDEDELKIDIPTDAVTSSYDGEFLILKDQGGETVRFRKLP